MRITVISLQLHSLPALPKLPAQRNNPSINMFKYIVFATLLALAVAEPNPNPNPEPKPGFNAAPLATAPLAYTAPAYYNAYNPYAYHAAPLAYANQYRYNYGYPYAYNYYY